MDEILQIQFFVFFFLGIFLYSIITVKMKRFLFKKQNSKTKERKFS